MTTTLFAPPELFSAYAIAVDGSDPDIPKGTHLRIFAGLGASFPLAPFAVFKLASRSSEPPDLHVTDSEGHHYPGGLNLSEIGIGKATLMLGNTDTQRTVRVELEPVTDGEIKGAMLVDQWDRVIAKRNEPRWLFSAPVLHSLLVWGRAQQVSVRTKAVDISDIIGQWRQLKPVGILGLPVQDRHPWYIGVQDRNDGLKRVANGAPLRLNPMDRPVGPFDAIGPDDEVARVEAMIKSTQFGGGLESLLTKLVDDQTSPPWIQSEKEEMIPTEKEENPSAGGSTKKIADVPRLSTLQLAAIDPGLARFLGFADHIDDLPDLHGWGWDTLVVVGLFAISPMDFDRRGLDFVSLLHESVPGEDKLTEMLILAIKEASGRDVRSDVEELIALVRKRGLVVYACVTLVAPVPPWLPPSLPKPEIVQHHWQSPKDGMPSSQYRASFAFPRAPLISMSSIAAQLGSNWISRHRTVEVGNYQPPSRATPRFFGHENKAFLRVRELRQASMISEHTSLFTDQDVPTDLDSIFYRIRASNLVRELRQASGTSKHAALLNDQDIPANFGSIFYRVRASDFFGRFGDEVDFKVAPPPRPSPPPPILRYHFEPADIDLTSTTNLSPGVLKLTVAVPRDAPTDSSTKDERFTKDEQKLLSSAIVVPRIDDLAAGSLPLKVLTIRLDAQSQDVNLEAPGIKEVEFELLPGLPPGLTRTWTLSAIFKNTDNVKSAPAELPVKVTDVRPPKAPTTGLGLFWTSAPGPSPEVELKLYWPAPPKSLHRVYLTDQQGLGITTDELAEALPEAEPSRRLVAFVGCNKVLNGMTIDRKNFRLLTDQPIEAGVDGRAVLETTLPRSLETVQFLLVVPVGPDGAEPPFKMCGIVPVAVPDSRRPPSPRIDGDVDPVTGVAQIYVVADGFDRVALERDEPGLFTPGAQENEPPQFRIRRAVGAVADPIYACIITTGPLARWEAPPPGALFAGTVTDNNDGRGLEPFVRYIYWAEVRLPPERRLPATVNPIVPHGGISAVDPANSANHPRPMSLPSAPRVLMRIPPDPPAAPLPEAVTATRTQPDADGNIEVTIEISNSPRTHAKAIGPYRLAIWTQWPGQAIEAATNANGEALEGTWPDFSDGIVSVTVKVSNMVYQTSTLTLRLAFADPIGRLSNLTTIDLP